MYNGQIQNKQFDALKSWVGSDQVVKQRSALTIYFNFLSKNKMTPICYNPDTTMNSFFSIGDDNDMMGRCNTNNLMHKKVG